MRRYPIKALTALILAGSLAGCASPAVFVATQAASGVSYLTTGKGTTDHVISAALEEDCALHRAIRGNAVCQPRAEDRQIQTASLGEWPPVADFPDGDQGADPAPVHLAMAATAAPEPQAAGTRYYLVVGSFTSHANAQRAAQRGINGLQPARVIAAQLPRHTVYRVVVGPFDSARTDQTRRQLAAAGGATPWRLPVCNGPGIKGCIAAD